MSTVAVEQALAKTPKDRGKALLRIPEDQWFERKSNRVSARQLADALIGLANAEGGTLVVGCHGRRVEGVLRRGTRVLNEWMQAPVDFVQPPLRAPSRLVECANDERAEDVLLIFDVEPSEQVHSNSRDEVFLRVGDETRRLSFRQRQELLFDKGQAVFEAAAVPQADLNDLDAGILKQYASAVAHPEPTRLLAARGLLTPRGELTNAACLLFGNRPQLYHPEAYVRVLKYRGTDRGSGARQQLIQEVRCEGPIPIQLMEARDAVAGLQPSRRALGSAGKFEQIGLIPEDAWLEGLVNAVVHRSYSLGGDHIRVEIFDDRIEIESPGRFPGLANPDDPLHATRFARNPRIARVCADLNFGQELGEGIRRMFEEMRLAGLSDPLYQQTSGSVRLTLSTAVADRNLEASLPPNTRTILRLLRDHERLSTGDLVEGVGLSRPAVLKRLSALQEAGLIEWVGNHPRDPRAYWRITTA